MTERIEVLAAHHGFPAPLDTEARPQVAAPIDLTEHYRPTVEVLDLLVLPPDRYAEHYRECIKRMGDAAVYVTYTRASQQDHEHYFSDLTRFGDGVCQPCGAQAFSVSWVAVDVFGHMTAEWALAQQRTYAIRLADQRGILRPVTR